MPSQNRHADPRPRRTRITRSSWFFPLLLVIGPMLGRGAIAVGGVATVAACSSGPTFEDCQIDYEQCLDACAERHASTGDDSQWSQCVQTCEETEVACVDDAYAALERDEANAAAGEAFAATCAFMAVCALESLGDEGDEDDGDDGDDGWDSGDDSWDSGDDYGEDWGEHQPGTPATIAEPPPLDLPDEG